MKTDKFFLFVFLFYFTQGSSVFFLKLNRIGKKDDVNLLKLIMSPLSYTLCFEDFRETV